MSKWHDPGYCVGMEPEVLSRMKHLRRMLMIHAYLYYGAGESIWEDHIWDQKSRELFELQKKEGWNINFYDEIFQFWEGQSGYWMPTNDGHDPDVKRVALSQLAYNEKLQALGGIKTPLGYIPKESA